MAFENIACSPFNPKGVSLVLLVFHQYTGVIKCALGQINVRNTGKTYSMQ